MLLKNFLPAINFMKHDIMTKIFLVIFVIALSYLLLSLTITPLLVRQPRSMVDMMGFSQQSVLPNTLALVIALGIGFFLSLYLKSPKQTTERANYRKIALSVVKKKLSADEKKMLKQIERAGTITQDSLRARLGWSKAKVSTILTRLDKMNLVQKERQGKTYKIFLSKDLQ